MRKPRDLNNYVSRDQAIYFLLSQAAALLEQPQAKRFKADLRLSFWDPAWTERGKEPKIAKVEKRANARGKR